MDDKSLVGLHSHSAADEVAVGQMDHTKPGNRFQLNGMFVKPGQKQTAPERVQLISTRIRSSLEPGMPPGPSFGS
jgi:hypothetical protein